MAEFRRLPDVLRLSGTRVLEAGPCDPPYQRVRFADSFLLATGDLLVVTARRSLVDRLLRRQRTGRELVEVGFAGGTFTWVRRGAGKSPTFEWRRGDRVDLIAPLEVPHG